MDVEEKHNAYRVQDRRDFRHEALGTYAPRWGPAVSQYIPCDNNQKVERGVGTNYMPYDQMWSPWRIVSVIHWEEIQRKNIANTFFKYRW